MIYSQAIAQSDRWLNDQEIIETLAHGLDRRFVHQKVLVIIPDHTRSLPLPFLFRTLLEILQSVKQIDFMVALGTHPILSNEAFFKLLGINADDHTKMIKHIRFLNHDWEDNSSLVTLGVLEEDEIKDIAKGAWHPSLPERVIIRINKAAIEYDHVLILGPTFPHEVAGFSGGAKYLFPGISGPEMINASHWLGALSGVVGTIGFKDTPVRRMINSAAKRLSTPVTLIALVAEGNFLSGLFLGDIFAAWAAAAELSAQRHIRWFERPFQRVLSCAPAMYTELWTAAKAMYKLEPVVAVGGEVVIFAPHLDIVSQVHGKHIFDIGYHILPWFLKNWEDYKHIPLGVLAHSTHLRGSGILMEGLEKANVNVTLASQISAKDCAHLNLGYLDPRDINIDDWKGHEAEGILYVQKAGEMLYRLKP